MLGKWIHRVAIMQHGLPTVYCIIRGAHNSAGTSCLCPDG